MNVVAWGPLQRVTATEVLPTWRTGWWAEQWEAGVAEERARLAAGEADGEWDGDVVRVAALHPAGAGAVQLVWYRATWAEVRWCARRAVELGDQPAPPGHPEWSAGLSCAVWLRCADGLVAGQRGVGAGAGWWTATVGELAEPGDLPANTPDHVPGSEGVGGEVDLAAWARRGLDEELGLAAGDVTAVAGWRWTQQWRSGWSTRLHVHATTPLRLGEVRDRWRGAADAAEVADLYIVADVPADRWAPWAVVPPPHL